MDANDWDVVNMKGKDVVDASKRDSILTKFIGHTHVDPSLASALLDATGWDLAQALATYERMKDIYVCTDAHEQEPVAPGPKDAKEGGARGKGSRTKRRGLAAVGEEAMKEFYKGATSVSERQITIEEQFFTHSFHCLDFTQFEDGFQKFLVDDIIEKSHKDVLEKAGLLNWWTSTGKLSQLEPLATSGDGNCLLHATSLYMWGLQDQQLILRNSLYKLLTTGSKKDAIFKRWKHQTELRNKEAGGLTFSEEEWQFEWAEIIRVANSKPRRAPSTESLRRYSTLRLNYESLEEIHVFALAHVLKRPIIVVADRVLRSISGDELAPIYFGGIYLPLEEKTVCCQSPVVLTYHASHFAALVAKEDSKGAGPGKGGAESAVPLVTPDGKLLPLQFDNEVSAGRRSSGEYDPRTMQLLNQYFKIKWFQLAASPYAKSGSVPGDDDSDYDHLTPSIRFPAACIEHKSTPIYQQTLIQRYIENARTRFEEGKLQRHQQEEEKAKREEERRKKEEEQQMKRPVPCRGKGCDMFGTPATKFLCSSCSKLSQTDGTFSVQPVSPGLPSSPDIATPSSPSVVNPCQTSDYSRQNSKSKIPTQPSQHSSSKEIPPSAVLHSSSSSPKVQAPLSPPQPAVAKQHSNKPVFLETSGTTKAPVDQARKVPLAPQSSSLTKDTKSDSTHLEPKSGTPPCGSAASNPTKLPAAAKPGRVMHVRPTPGKYSRDSIQPLTANDKGTCATDGCGFYSSGQSQYCTKCRAARPPE